MRRGGGVVAVQTLSARGTATGGPWTPPEKARVRMQGAYDPITLIRIPARRCHLMSGSRGYIAIPTHSPNLPFLYMTSDHPPLRYETPLISSKSSA